MTTGPKVAFFFLLFTSVPTQALSAEISLAEWALNLNGTIYVAGDVLPGTVNTAGFNFATGLGAIRITPSFPAPGNYFFGAYFDHEIDETLNTFFNEFGAASGTPPAGLSWEIDEPGFVFGDIFTNFGSGALDNSNGVPPAAVDDVSMAMIQSVMPELGDVFIIDFLVSSSAPASGFFLTQTDPNSGASIYFSTSVNGEPQPPIPEPAPLLLVASAIGIIAGARRLRAR